MNGRGAAIGRGRTAKLARGTKAVPVAETRRPAGRERSAPGTLRPTTGRLTHPAPLSSGPLSPEPRRLTGSYSCC